LNHHRTESRVGAFSAELEDRFHWGGVWHGLAVVSGRFEFELADRVDGLSIQPVAQAADDTDIGYIAISVDGYLEGDSSGDFRRPGFAGVIGLDLVGGSRGNESV
jgi:hypothetical protein